MVGNDDEQTAIREEPRERLMITKKQSSQIDDIPIPVSQPKTFEELLEEKLKEGDAQQAVKTQARRPPK